MKINIFKNFIILEDMTRKEHQKLLQLAQNGKISSANILPRPVIRDGNGKLIKDYMTRDFYSKLQKEIFESFKANFEWFLYREEQEGHIRVKPTRANSAKEDFAEKIADIITVCISCLNAIGYDEEKRSELFAKVNEKNEKRGYFEEKETEKTATTKIFSEKEIKSCVERLQDLVRDRQSFLTGEEDHDEVFLKDIHYLEMAMTLLEMKEAGE